MDDRHLSADLHAFHSGALLPPFLHHDPKRNVRRTRRRSSLVCKMHLSDRYRGGLFRNHGSQFGSDRDQVLRCLLYVLPDVPGMG